MGQLKSGELVGGCYRVEHPLAEGAVGVVYKAKDEHLERPVALKVLHDWVEGEREERLRLEAAAMATLRSDHVVGVYAFGRHGERRWPYFAMEFVKGRSLRSLINEYYRDHGAQVPIYRALQLLRDLALGLVLHLQALQRTHVLASVLLDLRARVFAPADLDRCCARREDLMSALQDRLLLGDRALQAAQRAVVRENQHAPVLASFVERVQDKLQERQRRGVIRCCLLKHVLKTTLLGVLLKAQARGARGIADHLRDLRASGREKLVAA